VAQTLPVVATPAPAPAPAARPARAAGPAGVSFDALLAGAGGAPVEASGAQRRDEPSDEPEIGPEILEATVAPASAACDVFEIGQAVGATAAPPAPASGDAQVDDTAGEDRIDAAAVASPSLTSHVRPVMGAGAIAPRAIEEGAGDDAAVTSAPPPPEPAGRQPADAREGRERLAVPAAGTEADPPGAAAPDAPRRDVAPARLPDDAPAMPSAMAAPAAVDAPEPRDVAADERPADASVPSIARRPALVTPASPRADARAAARSMVATAVRLSAAESPAPPPSPNAVATAPMPVVVAVATAVTSGARPATAQPSGADHVLPAPAFAPVPESPLPAAAAGRHDGNDPPHGRDGSRQAGRPAGAPPVAALPASMIFPGHTAFAAALSQALPMASGLPPAFAAPALETVVPQIVRSLQMQVTAGGGDMTLTLTPEHLGTVTIDLRVDQQKVSATLGADTPAVRAWIAAHQPELEAGLRDLGLQLDEFVVRDDDPRERRQPDGRGDRQPRKRVKRDDAIFEVRV
jgi:hypothetical protein